MHRFMNELCLNCNKFSHCNNNDLICLAKYKDKEQECEELKKQQEQYKPFYELGAKCTQLNEVADGLSNKCDKYKQALDEIEDIADDYNRVKKPRNIIEMVLMKYKTLSIKQR